MSWVATAVIGGAVVGGVITASASKDAADTQAQASQYATDAQVLAADKAAAAELAAAEQAAAASMYGADKAAAASMYGADLQKQIADDSIAAQMKMYNEARQLNAPYVRAGKKSLKNLQQLMQAGPGEFTEDPGYQFRLQQGNDNILANASATGGLASGRTMKALQEYGQDYASNEYTNFINRFYQSLAPDQFLVSLGQNAAALQGNNAMSVGQGISNTNSNLSASLGNAYSNLSSIYSNQGAQLAAIQSGLGSSLANTYTNSGNAIAQNAIAQGNIAASNTINQANAWTSGINNMTTGLAYLAGNGTSLFAL